MNLDKIRRRDWQLIAYHEAGHLIALTRLGGYGHIRIEDAPSISCAPPNRPSNVLSLFPLPMAA